MNVTFDAIWADVGLVIALLVCIGLLAQWLATHLRHVAAAFSALVRRMPVGAALAGGALCVMVSYAGSKPVPTTYTIEFEPLPTTASQFDSMSCETGKVYSLPKLDGYRWKCESKEKIYDGGLQIFDLGAPGDTIRMVPVQVAE